MLLHFSTDFKEQVRGIILNNHTPILWFIAFSVTAYVSYHTLGYKQVALPVAPVSIIGVAIAIFLGFRNSSAYDRWWEARKIWGGIVNDSRSWAMEVCNFSEMDTPSDELKAMRKKLVYRHIAWLYALAMHLRKKMDTSTIEHLLPAEDMEKLASFKNIPVQLTFLQAQDVQRMRRSGYIDDFSRIELNRVLKEFNNLQGKAERIKNTVFPYYYNYFTRLFLWLFLFILPFALVKEMGWESIPLSIAISFVFHILDKSGAVTEEPFEGRASDTPMTTLCRTIEIDLRQMLGETTLPEPNTVKYTRYNAAFLD